jgi:hypothetical protein
LGFVLGLIVREYHNEQRFQAKLAELAAACKEVAGFEVRQWMSRRSGDAPTSEDESHPKPE